MRKFASKKCRLAHEKITMDAEERVLDLLAFCIRQRHGLDRESTYTDDKICSSDIIFTVS